VSREEGGVTDRARRLPGRLLALTPGTLDPGGERAFLAKARTAVGAGLDSILLREPDLSDAATLALGRELRGILGPTGWLGLHDRAHLATAAGADAVHLGWKSLPIPVAREILDPSIAIGFSAHAADDPGAWSQADYIVFGPVFETASKRAHLAPAGVEGLARAVQSTRTPVWALGGITPANAAALASSRCAGIAVRGAVFETPDTAAAVARLR
jgi:thiamine-phosphate pyrophosphorylase